MLKPTPIQSGIAGEYLVAGELCRRGYIASLTLRNTKGVAVLAASADAYRSVGIQVKTSQGDHCRWLMGRKAETDYGDRIFYVFVNLHHNKAHPTFHVVPSRTVADYARKGHERYLATPGRSGQQRRDNSIRTFEDEENRYLDK